MDAVGGRNHALADGFWQLAPQTARPSCHEGECCHPASRLFVQPSANTELRLETKRVDSMLRPRARRRRQSATLRTTAARTKPAPFRNDAFRHGRGPLGPVGLATCGSADKWVAALRREPTAVRTNQKRTKRCFWFWGGKDPTPSLPLFSVSRVSDVSRLPAVPTLSRSCFTVYTVST